jgi:hypothetical protein
MARPHRAWIGIRLLDAERGCAARENRSVAAPSKRNVSSCWSHARQRLTEAISDPEYLPAALNLSLVDDVRPAWNGGGRATPALDLAQVGNSGGCPTGALARAIANLRRIGAGRRPISPD